MDTVDHFIAPHDLAARLGRPGAPLLLDVRPRSRFSASDRLLPGALRCAPADVEGFASTQAPGDVVVYCVYGHEVGAQAAATLAAAGWQARALAGGLEGGEPGVDPDADLAAWRAAPLPRIRKRPDLGVTGEGPSRWVTRERPRIDRIACPWLLRRFVDPRAEILYVPADRVLEVARERQAVAFDVAGAPIGHAGDACSFDALLAAFDLQVPALARLATIVRGADTGRLSLAPESAGLLAISRGLGQLHADDQAVLAAGMVVYDALYAWCAEAEGAAAAGGRRGGTA